METLYNCCGDSTYYRFSRFLILICTHLFLVQSIGYSQNNPTMIPDRFLSPEFQGNGDFNVLTFGNFSSNSGVTEGRLAIAGNFSFTQPGGSYSVGFASPGVGSVDAPDNTSNFVVNGNFSNASLNWQVRGNFIYNTSTPGNSLPSNAPGTTTGGVTDHIIFSDGELQNYFIAASDAYNARTTNGTVEQPNPWDPISLTGTDPVLNIFELTIPAGHSTGFDIEVPVGSSVLVNVTNTNVTITGGNMIINGSGIPNYGAGSKVMFNFPNATQISLTNFGMLAGIFAPRAGLSGDGGAVGGEMVVGGDLSQAGGFGFYNVDFDGDIDGPMPVKLINFDAEKESGMVLLTWKTSEEVNSDRFEVQYSVQGKTWETIGEVEAAGESASQKTYSFLDQQIRNGSRLYRLKMIDTDGSFAYSIIRSISSLSDIDVVAYPNPTTVRLYVSAQSNIKLVSLTNMDGKVAYHSKVIPLDGIDCSGLPAGLYILDVRTVGLASSSRKILIGK